MIGEYQWLKKDDQAYRLVSEVIEIVQSDAFAQEAIAELGEGEAWAATEADMADIIEAEIAAERENTIFYAIEAYATESNLEQVKQLALSAKDDLTSADFLFYFIPAEEAFQQIRGNVSGINDDRLLEISAALAQEQAFEQALDVALAVRSPFIQASTLISIASFYQPAEEDSRERLNSLLTQIQQRYSPDL